MVRRRRKRGRRGSLGGRGGRSERDKEDSEEEEEEEEEESSSEGLEAEDWAQGVWRLVAASEVMVPRRRLQCPTLHFLEGEEDSESDSEEEEEDDDEDEGWKMMSEEDDEVPVPSFGGSHGLLCYGQEVPPPSPLMTAKPHPPLGT